jgi:uncharacterized protein
MVMKILLLLALVFGVLWLLKGRRRGDAAAPKSPPRPAPGPQTMLACAHCGVHLPQGDALMDVAGRPFCTDAHRLAGPH